MKKTQRTLIGMGLALIMAFGLLSGCGSDSGAASSAEAPASSQAAASSNTSGDAAAVNDGDILIGFTVPFYDDPYFLDMRNTVKDFCDAKGWGFTEFDAAADAAAQADAVENMIATGIDCLVIGPVDASAIVPSIENCNEKNIPVICVDCGADGGEILTFVESDNHQAGVLCGEYMVEQLGGKGRICITNCPSGSAARDREEGFREVLKNYPDIEILDAQESVSQTKGQEIGDTWAIAYPDLDGVFSIDDNSGLGVESAMRTAGVSDLVICSVDGSSTAAMHILDDEQFYDATAAQQPILIAVYAMEAAEAYFNGEGDTIEPHIQIPVFMVTKDNAQDYLDGKLTEYDIAY